MAKATQVKICGIDTPATALSAVAAGTDAIGLMFAPQSARCLTLEQAAEISAVVQGQVRRVGVFVDQDVQFVQQVLGAVELDVLQFHGGESAEFCRQFELPYIKVLRAGQEQPPWIRQHYPDAWAWMLDTHSNAGFGGTGETFDWSLWPVEQPGHWMLAGGLTPENVESAVLATRPWFVDVSSGVEGVRKGQKDPAKMVAFVAAVRAANAALAAATAR
ncbi:MAG: phosphoribosylanthranilate isomerase [Pseudomonadales bacterium]